MPNDSLQANINSTGVQKNTFDAIVIGSGISGGWAAKELCEHGVKTLMLERGRNVVHNKDYPTAIKSPWEFPHRGRLPLAIEKENPIISRCYAFDETAQHFFVKDKEHPYVQEKPFDWIRGYQVGGKSLMWARETQRWSQFEFEAPLRDGFAVDWSSTLPWAEKTGNLTLRPDSVVHSIIYDEQKGKAAGVRVIDAKTKQSTEYFAKIIFVNAACLNSNLLLLNSTSSRFPNGLGNDHDILGRYMAFQNYRGSLSASIDGPEDKYYYGSRPVSPLMPSFRNVYKQETDFLRGYLVFWGAYRNTGNPTDANSIGAEFKEAMSEAGNWGVYMSMQGEVIPKHDNHVRLSKDLTDEWGIPQLITSIAYDNNDEKMVKDFLIQGAEILETAGCKNIIPNDSRQAPGLDIHEMGGVRMGKDPTTSMLNKFNQLHACKNVFVTDGACMTSVGNQNPSLTFMAITARAANYALDELKKRNI